MPRARLYPVSEPQNFENAILALERTRTIFWLGFWATFFFSDLSWWLRCCPNGPFWEGGELGNWATCFFRRYELLFLIHLPIHLPNWSIYHIKFHLSSTLEFTFNFIHHPHITPPRLRCQIIDPCGITRPNCRKPLEVFRKHHSIENSTLSNISWGPLVEVPQRGARSELLFPAIKNTGLSRIAFIEVSIGVGTFWANFLADFVPTRGWPR